MAKFKTAAPPSRSLPLEGGGSKGGGVLLLILALGFLPFRSIAFDLNNLDMDKVASGGSKLFKAAAGVSDADEQKIGREVAANLAARYGLVEDADKVRYINLIGQAIVKKCSRSNIPYHFAILKSKEINALAAPGGYIFVTQGLLDTLQDESELSGVLAHEVSHVTQRHIVKAMRKANLMGAGVDFASAANPNAAAQLSQVSDFSINMLSNGLSRGDELEADQLGTVLAAKTGYDPVGLRNSIQRLGDKGDTSALSHFNKTHPPSADRLKAIDKTLASNHLTDSGPRLADRFRKTFPKA
jgi:predicted Zn-dependent protease